MGVYLAVVSKRKHNLENVMASLLERKVLEMSLHFEHGERKVYFSKGNAACLVSFSFDNSVILPGGKQYCESADGALALQGNIIKQEKEIKNLNFLTAKDVMDVLALKQSDEWFKANYTGDYSYVSLSCEGEITASTDTMGFEHLYYGEDEDNYYVSNRIRLIKCLHKDTQVDLFSMVYIPYDMNLVGDNTSETGIKRLKQKQVLTINREGRMQIRGNEWFVLEDIDKGIENEGQYIRDNVNVCINQINAMLRNVDEIKIPLTGGRDSRAILALLLQSEYRDKVTVETEGYPDHSDVIVAKALAEHYGIPHETILRREPKDFSVNEIFSILMSHVFQSDGCKGGWDADEFLDYHMIGHASEGFKEWEKAGRYIDNPEQLIGENRFVNSKYRYAKPGLINEMNKYYDKRTRHLVGMGYDYQRVLDSYKITDRIPNWHGYFNSLIQAHQGTLMVLNNENLMKFGYTLGGDNRRVMRTHYEIMRQADKWLVEQPFGVVGWNPDLAKYLDEDINIYNKPIPASAHHTFYGSWQWKINESPTIRKMFWELLNSYDNSGFWDYYDKKIVEHDILSRQFDVRDIITIYAVITNYMYYHKIELPSKIDTSGEREEKCVRFRTERGKRFWAIQHNRKVIPENALTIKNGLSYDGAELLVSKATERFAWVDPEYDLSRYGNMESFLAAANNPDYRIYVCGRWEEHHVLPQEILHSIEALGTLTGYVCGEAGNFISVIDGNTSLLNKTAAGHRIVEVFEHGTQKVRLICGGQRGGDEAYIIIDEQYFKGHCPGITFVVYDKIIDEIVDYMTYNVDSGYTVRYQDWGWKRDEFLGLSEESKVRNEKQSLINERDRLKREVNEVKRDSKAKDMEHSKALMALREELEKKFEQQLKDKVKDEKARITNKYEDSTSFKIGKALTAVPRKLKKISKK